MAVCKEQSPSSREDGWELVEELEMGPGARQNETLSVSTEARFVKLTIVSGCERPSQPQLLAGSRALPTLICAPGIAHALAGTIRSATSPTSLLDRHRELTALAVRGRHVMERRGRKDPEGEHRQFLVCGLETITI